MSVGDQTRADVHTSGPTDADHTVLLIPGGMCTAAFYDEFVKEPALSGASIRFVSATLPGFGTARPPVEPTMQAAVEYYGRLASEHGCDAVVGHSVGANLALEMTATGAIAGPVVLLEPSFSREDEYKVLSVLDRLGRVPGLGNLVWLAAVRTIGMAMKDELSPELHKTLAPAMAKGDPHFCRNLVHDYFAYLDRHGSVVARLCESGASAIVVFGDDSEVGLTDAERAGLEACPSVTLVDVAESGHMLMIDQPARTAELVLALFAAGA